MKKKILVAIFHKDGKDNDNFEQLKNKFSCFDIYIPKVEFYGNKWTDTKDVFLKNNYDSLFTICSDVSIVCGNIEQKINEYAADKNVGSYGFGTINNCTFDWLRYNNLNLLQNVPFIEGYCFGVNKEIFPHLNLQNIYGYGIDVEIGYKTHLLGLKCILDNEVCVNHAYGKSYDNIKAQKEYQHFLIINPGAQSFLDALNIIIL